MTPRASVPFLVPRPRELMLRGGFLNLPAEVPVRLPDDADPRLTGGFLRFAEAVVKGRPEAARFFLTTDPEVRSFFRIEIGRHALAPQGFEIEITSVVVHIRASDAAGVAYAFDALRQMLREDGTKLACVNISDTPDLEERGFMLDVSRTKVPTMPAIFQLIDRLATLRYNRLQLYVEHTFAFAGHETVWKDASPLTGEEIRAIDTYCRERFITLIPNLNGFGHFERWLKHPEYNAMAECPGGFWHDLAHSHRDPGTLKPEPASLEFMAKLYDDYLPNFSANEFNVGGDEPWELGQGWSKPLCEARGKQTVYLEHMAGLHRLCTARGKRMQFWADILLEHPERAGEAPADAVPVIWGYDAGHPFDAQCATLKALGRRYLVAPGASTWNSFTTRRLNAETNIGEAVMYAQNHDAAGILMTAWGDNGNHWAWPVMYPYLTLAGALAWNRMGNLRLDLDRAVAAVWFDGYLPAAQALAAVLDTDAVVKKSVRNKSVLWELLFNPPARRDAALAEVSEAELRATLEHLDAVEKHLAELDPARLDAAGESAFIDELRAALALSRLGVRRGLAELTGTPDTTLRDDLVRTTRDYERAWQLRARTGGLAESVGHLNRVLNELPAAG